MTSPFWINDFGASLTFISSVRAMMGVVSLVVILYVCGASGGVYREWTVPLYGSVQQVPLTHYYSYYSHQLPSVTWYGSHWNPADGLTLLRQVQNGAAQTGNGAGVVSAQLGTSYAQAGNGLAQTGNGAGVLSAQLGTSYAQAGNGLAQSGNVAGVLSAQSGTESAQAGNGLAQSGNVAGVVTAQFGTESQAGNGLAQSGNGAGVLTAQGGALQSGNGASQTAIVQTLTGGSPNGEAGDTGSSMWTGYTMYQSSDYPALLPKVNAALQANGPELTADLINFAGFKTVGTESQTGPGTVILVNFGTNANKNCYAYLVEPTGKTPEIPKDSIVCAN